MPNLPVSLYLSYDGILEPLGQTQILPYVRGLADQGLRCILLSFEKRADLARGREVVALRGELAGRGIQWIPLRYHKRPSLPATLWDMLRGAVVGTCVGLRAKARIVHCRSYVAGVMALAVRAVCRAKMIFDMRGFWPEERVEGGIWRRSSARFWMAKKTELLLFKASDAVVVLTERARKTLAEGSYAGCISPGVPVRVIPCCVDLGRFTRPNVYDQGGDGADERVLVYLGSIGTWYMLEEMLDFFTAAQTVERRLRFLILNRSEKETIRQAIGARGLRGVRIEEAAPSQVAEYLSRAYAGIFFIRPSFSKRGASPTKLGEYLAGGLPVIVNAGVGDADELVKTSRVGVIVNRFAADEYRTKWRELEDLLRSDGGLRERCRETAQRKLDLRKGMELYRQVYEGLLDGVRHERNSDSCGEPAGPRGQADRR